mmetsp:Transcript_9192/g.13785  ORF Transcript_9192/g.13785 Transcript_9192/m.13785 type:complete len:104 (-) Transcript_9192:401-712(-)
MLHTPFVAQVFNVRFLEYEVDIFVQYVEEVGSEFLRILLFVCGELRVMLCQAINHHLIHKARHDGEQNIRRQISNFVFLNAFKLVPNHLKKTANTLRTSLGIY